MHPQDIPAGPGSPAANGNRAGNGGRDRQRSRLRRARPRFGPVSALALLALAGCTSLLAADYSAPLPDQGRPVQDRAGLFYLRLGAANGVELERDDVDVLLRTHPNRRDYRMLALGPLLPLLPSFGGGPSPLPPKVFYLEVHFGSPQREVRFVPSLLVLHGEQGERLSPIAASQPVPSGQASQFYTPDSASLERRQFTAQPGTRWCVVLEYYRNAPSSFGFELDLNAFWADSERVPFERVRFARSTSWLIRWGGTEPSCG